MERGREEEKERRKEERRKGRKTLRMLSLFLSSLHTPWSSFSPLLNGVVSLIRMCPQVLFTFEYFSSGDLINLLLP